jgi:hypothetical protein
MAAPNFDAAMSFILIKMELPFVQPGAAPDIDG